MRVVAGRPQDRVPHVPDELTKVWTMDTDGTDRTPLAGPNVFFARAQRSPDGERLVYQSNVSVPGVFISDGDGLGGTR